MMAKLGVALGDPEAATGWLMRNALTRPEHAGAGPVPCLDLLALVMFRHMWGRIAAAAQAGRARAGEAHAFYANKLVTARYFFSHVLPETQVHRARVEAGADPLMALAAEAF